MYINNKGEYEMTIVLNEEQSDVTVAEISLSEVEKPRQERIYKINSAMKDGVQYVGKSVLTPLADREYCFQATIKGQTYIVTQRKDRGYLIIS
jgi:hypothetical protein